MVRASLSALAILSCVWLSFFSVVAGVDFAAAAAESGVGAGTLDGVAEEGLAADAEDGVPAARAAVAGAAAALAGVVEAEGSSSITMKRALDTSLLRLASLLRGGMICESE